MKLRATAVLLLCFVITAYSAIAISHWAQVGDWVFGVTVVFGGGFLLRTLALLLLHPPEYRRTGILGGYQIGNFVTAVRSGSGGTWPFAMLIIQRDKIILSCPHGTFEGVMATGDRFHFSRGPLGLFSEIEFEAEGQPVRFSSFWGRSIESRLEEFGYLG